VPDSLFASETGQRFIGELIAALEDMPRKRLSLGVCADGACCAIAEMRERSPMSIVDRYGADLSFALISENDRVRSNETPEARWTRMYAWAQAQVQV
jgi:hypothetical protein